MTEITEKEIENFEEVCKRFCEGNDFILNPEKEHTRTALKGVLEQEKLKGLKYCPCRLQTGDFEKDIELVCPCNFKVQQTWKEKGMCWCGLFVKD